MTETPTEVDDEIGQFEFVDRTPSREEVLDLLKTLPPVFGVEYAQIANWVQGLPSSKKSTRVDEQGRKIQEYHDVTTLYVSVAGRLQMLRLAAEEHGWVVNFVPDPACSPPGMLQMDDRIVYREFLEIRDGNDRLLGSKPGMAWVPAKGGSAAAGSNPYEKVETAARGRALAAWGFGVLPGSGIASLEEMQGVRTNQQALAEPAGEKKAERPSREDMESQIRTLIEEVRQGRGKTQEQMFTEIASFGQKTFGKSLAGVADETGAVTELTFKGLKDGQLQLLVNALTSSLAQIKAEEPAL